MQNIVNEFSSNTTSFITLRFLITFDLENLLKLHPIII